MKQKRRVCLLICCCWTWLELPASIRGADLPEIPSYVLPPARVHSEDGQDAMGARLFRTTTIRRQVDLGGWWDFLTDPEDVGEKDVYFRKFPIPETRLWVPGTWNAQARYWQYVGPAWYQRTFETPADGNLRLRFGSVFYRSEVWLDGRPLGKHEGGYLPFTLEVKDVRKGTHRITVRVDNSLDEQTLPMAGVDWFPYGGIDRPIYAELVPNVWIEDFHVVSTLDGPGQARLDVRVFLRNLGAGAREETIHFLVDGQERHSVQRSIPPGDSEITFATVLGDPRLWSPEDPNLYSARLVLGPNLDDQFTRFGVRELRTAGSHILLNGSRVKLMGANRHEDHPDWGSALPPHLIRQDIEILKRLGANAVRAHYPQSEMFLDYCDQHGLLMMSEVPAWQYTAAHLSDPQIQAKIKRQYEQMVHRDMNHPSVLSWSLGNEWREPDDAYSHVRALVEHARKVDGSRLVTFITGGTRTWRVHELIDVLGINWAKYQWYDPITYLDRNEGDKSIADLRGIHQRYPDKPVILTEFGGAEAQAGWHNWGNVKWSEEYQARNVGDSGRHALEQDWISGGCVWQFADSRSAPERILAGRLRGWNGKGIVDGHRNPKMAFYELQRLFRAFDVSEGLRSGGPPSGGR